MKKRVLLKNLPTTYWKASFQKFMAAGLLSMVTGFSASAQWVVYEANELPNDFTVSPFITASPSNAPIKPTENSIITDPDNSGNKLLRFYIDENSSPATFLWRQNFAPATPTSFTLLIRAKGIESALRAFELDLDFAGFRETIYIINPAEGATTGTFTFNVARNNAAILAQKAALENASLPIDPRQWHTYRFTKNGGDVKMYIDENNTPVASGTVASTTSTNNFFRIGDGSSATTPVGALYDWMAWDVSNAYSPAEKAAPSGVLLAAKGDLEKAGRLSVSPNPSTGRFMISHAPARKGATLEIYSANGLKVKAFTPENGAVSTQINLSDTTGGLFTVVYSEGGARSTSRIIKQ